MSTIEIERVVSYLLEQDLPTPEEGDWGAHREWGPRPGDSVEITYTSHRGELLTIVGTIEKVHAREDTLTIMFIDEDSGEECEITTRWTELARRSAAPLLTLTKSDPWLITVLH